MGKALSHSNVRVNGSWLAAIRKFYGMD